MRISYNVSALTASSALAKTDNQLTASTERLSSGYKINHAADDPSGIARAKRIKAQLRGLSQAADAAETGINVVETAEGALQEMQEMVQRINELAVQAANGTYSDSERESIQLEVAQLKEEITRIAEDTDFNGKALLNGDCDLKGYASELGIKVSYYSDEVTTGQYTIESITLAYDEDGNIDLTDGCVTIQTDGEDGSFPEDAVITYDGNKVTITASNNFEVTFLVDSNFTADGSITLDLTGIGAMTLQIGANEGQTLDLRIPTMSLETLSLSTVDLSTQEGAIDAIEYAKDAIAYISEVRARLGAYQNRLEHTVESLEATEESVTETYSTLMDTDMAEEMVTYSNLQVLEQAGISVLSQANERPQSALQLLS